MRNYLIVMLLGAVLAAFGLAGTAFAAEEPNQCTLDQAPSVDAAEIPMSFDENDRWTIEQAIDHFGADRVCGVPCGGPLRPSCKGLCGRNDVACFYGRCIYL